MRLNLTVEGQTEEVFVRDVLAPYLGHRGVFAVARSVRTGSGPSPFDSGRGYVFRGGLRDYLKPHADILEWLREDRAPDVRFTSMFDLYGLPPDWPGWQSANDQDPYKRVEILEDEFGRSIGDRRFIPYLQIHEFEGLLFADIETLASECGTDEAQHALHAISATYHTPELINDGPDTHPSARLRSLMPRYAKTVDGPRIAAEIGIDRMCEACPHFKDWVDTLAALGEQ